jgi:hypothetical protein
LNNNKNKDILALFNNISQQFKEFIAFLHWLTNWTMAWEAEKKGRLVSHNLNTTLWVLPATQTPSTTTSTHPGLMNLSANQRTLTPKECQKQILEGRCLYCRRFGYEARAYPNKYPYIYPFHKIKVHITPFQCNDFTVQTAPLTVNTESIHITSPFFKQVETRCPMC